VSAKTEPSRSLEARVAALETHVSQLTQQIQRSAQDVAAARVLAGGADRDVDLIRGEIRDFRQATTSSFNALREDMTDLRGHVDTGFTEMRGKLDTSAAGQQQIVDLLTTLIGDRPDDTDSEHSSSTVTASGRLSSSVSSSTVSRNGLRPAARRCRRQPAGRGSAAGGRSVAVQ
jgi:hypothetical protein